MIEYKELNIEELQEDDSSNYASEDEVTKFVLDPRKYCSLTNPNYQKRVYNITSQFFYNGSFMSWFDLFAENGWMYVNTYWKNNHKVMTFIRNKIC